LRPFFSRNDDRLIAAPPELLAPSDDPSDFASEIRVEIAHECCQTLGIGGGEEEMVVVAQKDEGMDLDRIEARRAGEDSSTDLRDPRRRSQQKPPLDSPTSHFDERIGWMEPDSTPHAQEDGFDPLALATSRLAPRVPRVPRVRGR